MPLSQDDIKRVADALYERMSSDHRAWWVEPQRHHGEHDYLALLMEREANRVKMWNRIKESFLGWLAIGVFLNVVYWMGKAAYLILEQAIKNGQVGQ